MTHSPTPPVPLMATAGSSHARIAALAGRRPDAPQAPVQRFPLARVPTVRQQLTQLFTTKGFTMLVCAAACGADLLALEVAHALGIITWVVLPFAPEVFRRTSVTDRPGEWGPLYDRVIAEASRQRSLVVLHLPEDDPQTYPLANEAIVAKAVELNQQLGAVVLPTGILVWDGVSRGEEDVTQHFQQTCQQAGFVTAQILTV